MTLTDRQLREVEYHKSRAASWKDSITSTSYEILKSPKRRWWNPYWSIFTLLLSMNWEAKKALVVGCGWGQDALHLAKMGASVYAFDLSPDMLQIAKDLAARERLNIDFREMAAEQLNYPNDFFDLIFVRDVLHHCDIPKSLAELERVSKPGAFLVVDEMYTHSFFQRMRNSRIVAKWLYPKIVSIVYQGEKPYITPDERKLSEHDTSLLKQFVPSARCDYFNFLVNRIVPERMFLCKIDRILIKMLGAIADILGGRFVLTGHIRKSGI